MVEARNAVAGVLDNRTLAELRAVTKPKKQAPSRRPHTAAKQLGV
jgi:DNA-binding IscR family transcriptional regulator